MAIGRRELGAILLGAAAIMFYLMLLSTTSSSAQTGGGTTGGTTSQNGPNEGCDNPEEVAIFDGTENQITDQFEITGDTFRLSYETTLVDPDAFGGSLDLEVLDESGQPIGQGPLVFDEVNDSENILAGPGTFGLDIRADNVEYTVTVEDCVGTQPTTTQRRERRPQNERSVINVPNRPLPPSGGMPVYGVVTGFALAGAGLLALGLGIRRGPQR